MRIKNKRIETGLSQYRLAKITGVSQGFISALERGEKTRVGSDILLKLSRALDCTMEELMGVEPEETKAANM